MRQRWFFQMDRRTTARAFGFFLQCNGEAEAISWSCTASAVLIVLSQKFGIENHVRRINHTFYQKENDWGYSQFLPCEVNYFLFLLSHPFSPKICKTSILLGSLPFTSLIFPHLLAKYVQWNLYDLILTPVTNINSLPLTLLCWDCLCHNFKNIFMIVDVQVLINWKDGVVRELFKKFGTWSGNC